uniref:Glycosyltransferase family 25 n=1 Tax=Pithovirus LCPAC302 TaxID=2506593 RepID=A0A481Z7Q5_9VIRU|nr:MAG: glycosyltransferase family 25 [Pithovirus LCPAC302]
MRIPVYILSSKISCDYSDFLYCFFNQCKLFKIIDFPSKVGSVGVTDVVTEANQVIDALCDSHKHFPHDFTIIIKDTSVTNCDIHDVAEIILSAIKLNRHKDIWDLCYLCKWLDRCDLYKELVKKDGKTQIVKTFAPLGIQAIMFSPKGRDIVLGKKKMKNKEFFTPITLPLGDKLSAEISNKNIKATAVVPNLFDFDVLTVQTTGNELNYLKSAECRVPVPNDNDNGGDNLGAIPFFWFVVVVIGLSVVAWFFYQFIAKDLPAGTQEVKKVRRGGAA